MIKPAELLFHKKTKDGIIEVWNSKNHRWLTIDNIEQSRIDIKYPDQLASTLHQYFLSYLLFVNAPKNILLGGLGAGAIARYLHNKDAETQGCAVESSALIIELAKDYFYFPGSQWQTILDDLQNYSLKDSQTQYDLILIDIANNGFTPGWITQKKMLQKLKHQLAEDGVLVINLLVTDANSFNHKLKSIREVFERKTLCVSVPEHQNIVVFAFNKKPLYKTPGQLTAHAKDLIAYWGLDFQSMLKQIQKDNPKENTIFEY